MENMTGKVLKAIGIIIGVIVAVYIALVLIILLVIYFGIISNVDMPEVKRAEFEYNISFEIDGRTMGTRGVYKCEYDGLESTEQGWSRKIIWTSFVNGKETEYIPMYERDGLEICCYIGEPGYYMDDPEYSDYDVNEIPAFMFRYYYSNGDKTNWIYASEENLEKHHLDFSVIGYTLPEPIENTFK